MVAVFLVVNVLNEILELKIEWAIKVVVINARVACRPL